MDYSFVGPERYSIKPGWWKVDGEWYVVAWRAMQELHISKKKFKERIARGDVKRVTLNNSYNNCDFFVYLAEDLGIEGDGKDE